VAVPLEVSPSVGLLADYPHLVAEVGLMRWREWGRAPERTDPAFWVSVTGDEAGRISLPVSWVAVDADGQAVGAVGLGKFDIEERRDRSPWVLGMIVHPDQRRRGIGRLLLATLGDWAKSRGTMQVWVATGGSAVSFYNDCGWDTVESFSRGTDEMTTVLTRHL
jgi:GNAT superfamily N-acetyltransferase